MERAISMDYIIRPPYWTRQKYFDVPQNKPIGEAMMTEENFRVSIQINNAQVRDIPVGILLF